MEVQEKAYAKLNLSLDVGARRADGYHEMNMVMQTVSLCDELLISTTDDGTLRARSNLRFIPNDERNLAVKAARVFLEAAGESGQGDLSAPVRDPEHEAALGQPPAAGTRCPGNGGYPGAGCGRMR